MGYKFEGWRALDASSAGGKMVWTEFQPKKWEETDIDIRVTHCGICGTDLHTLRNGWGATPFPLTVGHEIVGVAVRVGTNAVGGIQVGDRVGVGAQADACLERFGSCDDCASGQPQYCDRLKWTYGSAHFNGDPTEGGYATHHRAASRFVVKIPDDIPSEHAAPMLCGGVTMFSPLRKAAIGPGSSVGIVGVGGLGHYGVLLAKAMGADKVVGISRRANKRAEVLGVGADDYIATEDDKDWIQKHGHSLDLIISTVASSKIPLDGYLSLLKKDGKFVQVGHPEDGPFKIAPESILFSRLSFQGSCIGSPDDIRAMLDLVSEKKVRGLIEARPMVDANQAVLDLEAGKAKYRYVLVNDEA